MKKFLILCLLVILFLVSCSSESSLAQDPNISSATNDSIPILAYVGFSPKLVTLEKFQEMKDAGITIATSGWDLDDQKELDLAQQVGMKICLMTGFNPEMVKNYMNHPALHSYLVQDEPEYKEFAKLAATVSSYKQIDPNHPSYINLFPNQIDSARSGGSYSKYIQGYLDQVKTDFLSFDMYPVGINSFNQDEWYEALEIVSQKTRAANIPFWGFIQSVVWDKSSIPVPKIEYMRIEAYSNLAYGAQGIEYFTYGTPSTFSDAPITEDGEKTNAYYLVQQMNREIQNRAFVFHNATVEGVWHMGLNIPRSTTLLTSLPEPVEALNTNGEGSIVSLLKKKGWTYMVVVNRNYLRSIRLNARFKRSVERIDTEGNITWTKMFNDAIVPGGAEIFGWKD